VIEPRFARAGEILRLAGGVVAVLGTATLLFTLAFREPTDDLRAAPRPVPDDLLDVTVAGETVTAVGHNGRILQSSDGGKSFAFRDSGVTTPLAAVAFRDERTGLAAGYGGVILRTTDGGRTWSRAASGTDLYLMSLHTRPGGDTFAAGEWGTVLRSRDEGASWETVTSREHDFIVSEIDLADDGGGWAVGELGRALVTGDGGTTWSPRQLLSDESRLFSVDVLTREQVWISAAGGLLLRTADGGASWERVRTPCGETELLRIRFAGARAYAVGRRCALVSDDAGAHWRRSTLDAEISFSWAYGLHVMPDAVWAAGYRESLFRADALDSSWQRIVVDRAAERSPGSFAARAGTGAGGS
jgi:photosystem II stability/assembly factor-like uncharacterized protein